MGWPNMNSQQALVSNSIIQHGLELSEEGEIFFRRDNWSLSSIHLKQQIDQLEIMYESLK